MKDSSLCNIILIPCAITKILNKNDLITASLLLQKFTFNFSKKNRFNLKELSCSPKKIKETKWLRNFHSLHLVGFDYLTMINMHGSHGQSP